MLRYFDHHAHIQDEAFAEDREAVLERAQEAGVARIVLPASTVADAELAIRLALPRPELFVAAGCHPQEATSYGSEAQARLRDLILEANHAAAAAGRLPVVRAIGEIGLDYYYENSPRALQKQVFWQQIELAHDLSLPFVVHERDAFQDCLEILRQAEAEGLLLSQDPFVCHCYSGSPEGAEELLQLGALLGFDGPLTFKNARRAPEVVQILPQDRLLIETDSPYLSPVPYRGKRNEPQHVRLIAAKVAELWSCSEEQVAERSWQNACRFYRLPLEL